VKEANVRRFLDQYEPSFNRALDGDEDMDSVATLYASETRVRALRLRSMICKR
jgi:hypothetical protein